MNIFLNFSLKKLKKKKKTGIEKREIVLGQWTNSNLFNLVILTRFLIERPFVCVIVSAFEATTVNIMFGFTKNTI
jgi:hypothetical protein